VAGQSWSIQLSRW